MGVVTFCSRPNFCSGMTVVLSHHYWRSREPEPHTSADTKRRHLDQPQKRFESAQNITRISCLQQGPEPGMVAEGVPDGIDLKQGNAKKRRGGKLPVLHDRTPSGHPQPADHREPGGGLPLHSIREPGVVRIAADVLKGEDRDGRAALLIGGRRIGYLSGIRRRLRATYPGEDPPPAITNSPTTITISGPLTR